MILAMLMALAQPTGTDGIKDPAERRAAEAIKVWMGCLAPLVADQKFKRGSEADAAAEAAFAACTGEEAAVRTALVDAVPARKLEPTMADMRVQFRAQVRQGAIRRKKT